MLNPATTAFQMRHRLGGYREYSPPPHLRTACEALWIHRLSPRAALADGAMHRVLPDPALSVAFFCKRESDGRVVDPRLVVIGPVTRPRVLPLERGDEMAAVKLKLEWARPVLSADPPEHHDALTEVSLILPGLAAPLLESLAATGSAEEAVGVLAAAVGRRTQREHRHRPEIAAHALDLIRCQRGRLSVEQVAHQTGLSLRHLRRTVRENAGVSVKVYARTVRFLNVVLSADQSAGARPAWSRLAVEAGFADQSHLIRECQAFCGLSPVEVHRERLAEDLMVRPRKLHSPRRLREPAA